ncbi:uncharacterized protein EV420DRAFT_1766945 [Desarmillaria tabescens]|uniref:Protein kinase domain-containing protein n=1 Tax=Armillaria tabescens TaxID=1929756 RepID=A0AA39JV77_ARMTA|nr:uncharacterized protein EV420DRAFT_1766945 [Desarmillaria tabescens]KAK0449541.1 hypothetical protein EV420DRAFT_1766945 [Desarmillaria tabescens]
MAPANIQEFLTFLPGSPRLGRNPSTRSTTEAYTAHNILMTPEDQPILSRLDHTLIPRLKEFISSAVVDFDIGDVSCQPMQQGLQLMQACRIEGENYMSLYGEFTLHREPVTDLVWPQKCGCFTFTLVGQNDAVEEQDIRVCSDEDTVYSSLLSKAEELSQSIRLDVTRKQEGAAAMAINLALQMITSRVEYGFFSCGFIAIAAQLVRSTDVSRLGYILLLSPAFRLSIVVAMTFSKLLPGRHIANPPPDLLRPWLLEGIQYAEEGQEGDEEDSHGRDEADPSDLLAVSLQVATNAMVLQHPWLRSSDIHHSFRDPQNIPTASHKNSGLMMEDPLLSLLQQQSLVQLCRRSPHVPSTNLKVVTLVSQIRVSRWSTVWKCCTESREEPFIIKLVSETHSDMIWKEFYMYEVVLKECPLLPRFYGMFQRPVGGWFAFYLEDVGDNLETMYGLGWSGVKRSMPKMQWQELLESVKQLHSLGVLHGDLEPRNVAQTAEGFKFFDFGHSELHHCQPKECDELQNLLSV